VAPVQWLKTATAVEELKTGVAEEELKTATVADWPKIAATAPDMSRHFEPNRPLRFGIGRLPFKTSYRMRIED
jgi:hypothetical protein